MLQWMQKNCSPRLKGFSLNISTSTDLMVHIKELTGKKIPPEQFKEVRTIRDVLNVLAEL